jgi:hypothetical protein
MSGKNTLTLLWVPSEVPCQSTITVLNKAQASAVAAAVRSAPAVPPGLSGKVSRPGNFPRPLTIFLTYPAQAKAEVVRVELNRGCVSNEITAPNRTARQMPSALAAALKPTAPQPWAAWL